jgi:hypothetical protein
VDHTFFSLCDLDDSTDSIEDLHDLAFVDITDFDILEDILDEVKRRLTRFLSLGGDSTLTIVLEINLDSEVFFDSLYCLATLTDDFTHLLFWYEYREEERSVWREFSTWSRETFFHLTHDVSTRID